MNNFQLNSKLMDFISLTQESQLDEIDQRSAQKLQAIFKHSTRCSVSSFAQRVLKSEFSSEIENQVDIHHLDLISFRNVSNAIADRYHVVHESPQLLLIKEGKCIYNASHSDVSLEKALKHIA